MDKKHYAAHKRIERNLYERGGHFYTMRTVNGKQIWRSLHTTDLEEARRLMRAEQAKGPMEAELASLKAQMAQLSLLLQEKRANAPLVQTNGTNRSKPTGKTLSEISNEYMESRVWNSDVFWSLIAKKNSRCPLKKPHRS